MKIIETIKQAIHNKFFKEVYCSHCGTKGKIMSFKKLKDDSLICKSCAGKIPSELKDAALEGTLQDYRDAVAYIQRSKTEFEPIFNNDAGFHLFEVDSKHRLFRIYGGKLIFELNNIDYYSFVYHAEQLKEGFISDKVKGDVHMLLTTKDPFVTFDETVAFGLKAKAEKKFLSNTYIHGNPKELDTFLMRFDQLLNMAKHKQAS